MDSNQLQAARNRMVRARVAKRLSLHAMTRIDRMRLNNVPFAGLSRCHFCENGSFVGPFASNLATLLS